MCSESRAPSSFWTWMTRRPSTYWATMARSSAPASRLSAWMLASLSSVLADSGSTVSVPLPPIRIDTSSPFSTLCSLAHSAGSVIASVEGPNRWTFRVSISYDDPRVSLMLSIHMVFSLRNTTYGQMNAKLVCDYVLLTPSASLENFDHPALEPTDSDFSPPSKLLVEFGVVSVDPEYGYPVQLRPRGDDLHVTAANHRRRKLWVPAAEDESLTADRRDDD